MFAARRKVLTMLYDHKLVVQEAEELLDAMRAKSEPSVSKPQLIGDSQWNRQFLKTLDKIATTQSPVLIHGEPGTGKMHVAQLLHYQSSRAGGPLVQVNCGATPEILVDSELFGHEKDAFTGALAQKTGKVELARGGTLILEEIDAAPAATQARLLRLLEESAFERVGGTQTLTADVRVVAIAHLEDLKKQIDEGRFRTDLYYRLSVSSLLTAPLRERREDIPTLATHFLHTKAQRDGEVPLKISPEAMESLVTYDWPGNARELANVIERTSMQCEESEIQLEHVPELAR